MDLSLRLSVKPMQEVDDRAASIDHREFLRNCKLAPALRKVGVAPVRPSLAQWRTESKSCRIQLKALVTVKEKIRKYYQKPVL